MARLARKKDEISEAELEPLPLCLPDMEEGIPLPANAADAFPELTQAQEVQMRAATIKLLADLQGLSIEPSESDRETAEDLAYKMITDPKIRPEFARYPNEVVAYLAGMVQQYNCALVNDLAEYKNYVIAKLVHTIEHAEDQKTMLSALRSLGDVDGVDAFKRRTEMTVLVKPIEQVEKDLHAILESLDHRVISESTEMVPA